MTLTNIGGVVTTIRGAVSATPPTPSSCDTLYYANRRDIELIYGKANVVKWADLDNEQVLLEISTRICWALQNAHAEMNDRMLGGPYVVPFLEPYPQQVITITARMAGLALYEGRGVTDYTEQGLPKHQLFLHKSIIKEFFKRVLSGQMRLSGVYDAVSYPDVIIDAPGAEDARFTF